MRVIESITSLRKGLIESNTTLREGRGNPIRVSKICNPRRGLPSRRCSKSWTRGWDSRVPPSMWCSIIFLILDQNCKICLKRTLDASFLDCLALTFCDVIGELLPEWACLTLQRGTTFLLTSKLADIPVSRVRKGDPIRMSLTCNPRRDLPSRGCRKSWTRG